MQCSSQSRLNPTSNHHTIITWLGIPCIIFKRRQKFEAETATKIIATLYVTTSASQIYLQEIGNSIQIHTQILRNW